MNSWISIILPIAVLIVLTVFVPSKDNDGVPYACKISFATDVCTKYMQEQQLKTLEEMSNTMRTL